MLDRRFDGSAHPLALERGVAARITTIVESGATCEFIGYGPFFTNGSTRFRMAPDERKPELFTELERVAWTDDRLGVVRIDRGDGEDEPICGVAGSIGGDYRLHY